jgi:hypothetical protein
VRLNKGIGAKVAKRIVSFVAALLVASGVLIAYPPAAGAAVHGTADRSTEFVLGETDPSKLPAGVSVSPALGGCLQEELCVWTDSLGPSQPAGYLYRWNSSWKGHWLTLTGTWYLSVSFVQNRGANTRARAQMSCPYIFPDATSGWIYYGSYKSLAGMIINDGAKCMNWEWV